MGYFGGVAGATNVTLRSPRTGATVETWSLPAYCCAIKSPGIAMGTGDNLVCIQQRIADALNIEDGDSVEFRFDATGEKFNLKVAVKPSLISDVLIHDFIHGLNLAESVSMESYGDTITFLSGAKLILPKQHMWAGMKIIQKQGSAALFFDGASKNNPRGPAGYGFRIVQGSEGTGEELVRGYGYAGMNRSNNEMEYEGLLEGIVWASRLDLVNLTICGDSELILNQLSGKYTIKNHRLVALHAKVHAFLDRGEEYGEQMTISYKHVSRSQNAICDSLANLAIATRETVINVNWPNTNKFMTGQMGTN